MHLKLKKKKKKMINKHMSYECVVRFAKILGGLPWDIIYPI